MSRPGRQGLLVPLGVSLGLLGAVPLQPQAGLEFPFEAVPLRGLKAEVATLIVGDGEGGALRMAAAALPQVGMLVGAGVEPVVVPLVLELEGVELFPVQEENRYGDLEICVYAITPDGSVAAYFSQLLRFDLEAIGEALYDEGVKFVGHLRLPAGSYRLRLLVREPRSSRFGLRTLPVEVPEPGSPGPHLSPPMIADSGAAWVLARASRRGNTAAVEGVGLEAYLSGLQVGDAGRLASALPVLRSGTAVSVELLGRLPAEVRWQVELTLRGERQPIRLAVAAAERQPEAGLERLELRFTVPELEPGAYALSVIADGGRQRTLAPALETVVLPDLVETTELNWTHLRQLISDQAAAGTGVELPRGRRRDRKVLDPEVRDAYRLVLEQLVTSGSVDAAVGELVKQEQTLFEADATTAFERITQTELAVARAVGGVSPEGLLPLTLLHMRAYRDHRSRRNFALATHSRTLASSLAQRYAQLVEEQGAAETTSIALACIAADMVEGRLWKQSEALLARAVELDADNGAALLMLATSRERFGDYASAVELSRRIVEADPKAPEARLRLAINLTRIGREREAERTLRQLVREQTEEWILTLAYQQLGKLLLDQERVPEASELLRRGVTRLPGQGRLYLQLSFALERLGQPRESAQVLRRLPIGDSGAASPRHAYSRAGTATVEPLWAALEQRVNVRVPLLARALSEEAR